MSVLEFTRPWAPEAAPPELFGPLELQPGDRALLSVEHPDHVAVMYDRVVQWLLDQEIEVDIALATMGEHSTLGDPIELHRGSRLDEEKAYMNYRGIPPENLILLTSHAGRLLPDGRLSEGRRPLRLQRRIERQLDSHTYALVIAQAADGFDEHPDHIAGHWSTVRAVDEQYRLRGSAPAVAVLNAAGLGKTGFTVNAAEKIKGARFHGSQYRPKDFVVWHEGSVLNPYQHLFAEETYDVIRPRRVGGRAVSGMMLAAA